MEGGRLGMGSFLLLVGGGMMSWVKKAHAGVVC